jgi:hypothetical protein
MYSTVFDDGFRRSLKVDDGATLKLSNILTSLQNDGQQQQQLLTSSTNAVGTIEATTSGEGTPDAAGGLALQEVVSSNALKRLSALTFGRRHQCTEVSGPALRVVDVMPRQGLQLLA